MEKRARGFEKFAGYDTATLLKAYQEGPDRIKSSIVGLTEQDLKASVIPGKWTIAEIVVHLADAEIIAACRIRQAFTEHKGDFPYYEEADWAKKLKYQTLSLEKIQVNIELFTLLRKTTSSIFLSCTDQDWFKVGIHPERGEMTLRAILELYADHSERHLAQILERRNLLKKPLQIELLIKDRLY